MKLITLNKTYSMLLKDTITDYISPNFIYLPFSENTKLKIDPKKPVFKGQLLFDHVYSPISGKILGIKECTTIKNKSQKCLVLKNDFKEKQEQKSYMRKNINKLTKEQFFSLLENFDLNLYEECNKESLKIVINSIEEAPYVGNFTYLNRNYAKEILSMIDALCEILKIEKSLILVKDTDYQSIESYNATVGIYPNITLNFIPDKYLISRKEIIKKYIGQNQDFIYLNVEEIYNLYNYLKRKKQIEDKIITISGNAIKNPQVIKCKIGTSIQTLIEDLIEVKENDYQMISNSLVNGCIEDNSIVVTKDLRAIFLMKKVEKREHECISCGKCKEVCPSNIAIYHLVNHKPCSLENCIKCGLCTYICPSNIPIYNYIEGDKIE